MLMTFLGMKLKVTQNRRRNERVCRMLPFPLCITGRRLVTNSHCMGKFRACAHRNYELAYCCGPQNPNIFSHEILVPDPIS